MISIDQARQLQGATVLGADGDELGTVDTLYADREDGHPTFATVGTGLFGSRTHVVPLEEAELRGDDLVVPYAKDVVEEAPSVDTDAELSVEEEERLYRHYGLPGRAAQTGTSGTASGAGTTPPGRAPTTR